MKKEKKKSVLTRIIPYAGKRKYMLFGNGFSALSGILLLMPMWYIHNIIKNVILNGNVNYTMIRENIAYAVIFPLCRTWFICFGRNFFTPFCI